MTSLLDNWTLDHAPGTGKAVDSTGAGGAPDATVGGLIGIGNTGTAPVPWVALPEPGTVLPPQGSADRAGMLEVFRHATGFDGFTFLSDWTPGTTTGLAYSSSVWINFSQQAVSPLAPTRDVMMVNFSSRSYTADNLWHNGGMGSYTANPVQEVYGGDTGFEALPGQPGYVDFADPNIAPLPGPSIYGNAVIQNPGTGNIVLTVYTTDYAFPDLSLGSDNWVHFMTAYRMEFVLSGGGAYVTERAVLVANDTVLCDVSHTGTSTVGNNGYFDFSAVGPTVAGIGNSFLSTSGGGLVAGVTEYAVYPRFIDWTLRANRYKYHISDGVGALQTWAPCDIGTRGTRPGFGTPLVYLSGGPASFVFDRAHGTTLTTNTSVGHGLFAVDDPPD